MKQKTTELTDENVKALMDGLAQRLQGADRQARERLMNWLEGYAK